MQSIAPVRARTLAVDVEKRISSCCRSHVVGVVLLGFCVSGIVVNTDQEQTRAFLLPVEGPATSWVLCCACFALWCGGCADLAVLTVLTVLGAEATALIMVLERLR